MEINSGLKVLSQVENSAAAKVAPQQGANIAEKLPAVEIKAPPEVKKFEGADLDQAVADLQKFVEGLGRNLSFRRDDSIDRSIITVRDASTNQLVRQIPAEEIVAIAREIRQDLDAKRAGMLLAGGA